MHGRCRILWFCQKREAMNPARPAIDTTPAERFLYDERYKADHAAEREHWRSAIVLAQLSDSILAALEKAQDREGR